MTGPLAYRTLVLGAALLGLPHSVVAQPAARTAPALPGLQTGEAPWSRGLTGLAERLKAIGLPAMAQESFVVHIHQRLVITVHGKPVMVPANIGINEVGRFFIAPLHTHDGTGQMHIESATRETFTLGQFFDVWGVRLTTQCLGGYCAKGADSLRVVSDGARVSGDPRKLILHDLQQIQIDFGDPRANRLMR